MDQPILENTADLLIYNARVITLNREQPYADLVAIKDGKVLAIGNKDDLGQFKGARTKLLDGEGGTVIPGFNDAHCHPLSFAVSLLSVDCSPKAVKNILEIQGRIRHQAEKTKRGKWIRAVRYDEFHLQEKRPPNRWELDEASPRHPVILVHSTGGKCVLNSLALRLAGISKDTPESSGGSIHRDPETGEPDGLICGTNEHVVKAIPPPDEEELEAGMKLVSQECLSHGVTSLQDTSWTNGWRHWKTWQRLIDRGIVSQRVSMLIGTEALEEFQRIDLSMGEGNHRLRIGGIKIALDESTGCPQPPQDHMNHLALRAREAGYQVAFHVSDVHALQASLTAIQFVCRRFPGGEHRFRLEHCSVCPPGLLLMLKDSPVIVVTQPSFLYYLGQRYQEEVMSHQTNWLWPFGSLHRRGVKLAFSSDAPLVSINPLTAIYAATTRKIETGQKLSPQEAVSMIDALKMYTLWGAYASLDEGIKGTISPGKFADLTFLSGDLTQMDPEQLRELKVIRTMINGKVMWGG